MYRVLITGAIHRVGRELLSTQPDVSIDVRADLPYEQILEIIDGYDCILSRSETDIDRRMIDAGTRLKVIARAAVGVGNIDIEYATEKGILVLNTPAQNTNSAAELTLGLMLAAFRQIVLAHATMAGGGWDRHRFHGRELKGKRIGIVGLGNVGHRVAKFARGFDMEVFAYDPYIADETFTQHGATKCQHLDELLRVADVLTVHTPKNKETTGMIGARELALLPRGAVVLNAARGGIIDEAALAEALGSGHVGAAGIDTWGVEPVKEHPLKAFPQVVMTPHIGATTEEAQLRIGQVVAVQTLKALRGEVVDFPVNMPHVVSELSPEIQQYSVLAERLGGFAAQYIDFNPSEIHLLYRGELTSERGGLIRLAFLKGFLKHSVSDDTHVSFINAGSLAEQRGFTIGETNDPAFRPYRSAVRVTIAAGHRELQIGGTVFDQAHERLTYLDGFALEMEPRGHLLVIQNDDRPGMIGRIGATLGDGGVNIDAFELSRREKGGLAMALLRVDEPVSPEVLGRLAAVPGVRMVRSIDL